MTDSYVPEVESRQFWDVPNDRFGSLPDAQYTLAECLLSGVKQPFSDSVLRGRFRPEADMEMPRRNGAHGPIQVI